MINESKLTGCDQRVIALCKTLDAYAKLKNSEIIITSTFEGKHSPNSWHYKKRAVDLVFKDINHFKICSEIYFMCQNQRDTFKGVTEFEMVRRADGQQHFHFAFGDEKALETFTGIY